MARLKHHSSEYSIWPPLEGFKDFLASIGASKQFDLGSTISFSHIIDNKLLLVFMINAGIPFKLFSEIVQASPLSFDQWAQLLHLTAVTPGDTNFVINPFHRDFAQVKIINESLFPFDNRMFNL